jgi:hypothetical protein
VCRETEYCRTPGAGISRANDGAVRLESGTAESIAERTGKRCAPAIDREEALIALGPL